MGFFVAQGILNLVENGPEDGGLLVMKGSSRLMKQFFDLHGRPPIPDGRVSFRWLSTGCNRDPYVLASPDRLASVLGR